jgi:hypothetical protein
MSKTLENLRYRLMTPKNRKAFAFGKMNQAIHDLKHSKRRLLRKKESIHATAKNAGGYESTQWLTQQAKRELYLTRMVGKLDMLLDFCDTYNSRADLASDMNNFVSNLAVFSNFINEMPNILRASTLPDLQEALAKLSAHSEELDDIDEELHDLLIDMNDEGLQNVDEKRAEDNLVRQYREVAKTEETLDSMTPEEEQLMQRVKAHEGVK